METVRQIINKIHPISPTEWDYFKEKLSERSIPKKTIFLHKGQIEKSLYFIKKGILRTWIDKNDDEITFDFAFENNFYSAYSSFLTQTPCAYNIESITDTIVLEIFYDDLQDFFNNTTIGQTIGRVVAEDLFISKCKRELSFLLKSAEQRYTDLFLEEPRLIEEIPLKYIATYIGITPQALSRIRNRIS